MFWDFFSIFSLEIGFWGWRGAFGGRKNARARARALVLGVWCGSEYGYLCGGVAGGDDVDSCGECDGGGAAHGAGGYVDAAEVGDGDVGGLGCGDYDCAVGAGDLNVTGGCVGNTGGYAHVGGVGGR